MNILLNFFAFIGRFVTNILASVGEFGFFLLVVLKNFSTPFYFKNIVKNFLEIGFFSLPVVFLTALFSGMVLALQSYIGFAKFSAESVIANVVVVSLTRELAPVLCALMVAGRIASSIAAEIGTMRVSEQVDALYTMKINSIKYLIVPRIIAALVALPILVLFSDIIGVMGGFLVAFFKLGFNPYIYIQNTYDFVNFMDVISGIVKAAVFGFIIAFMGCYFGYHTNKGAEGVGKATTNSVVLSSILIFIFDYIITLFFFKV